ncbi:hypothetical protein MCOR25_005695 [Pyricularia grisea]|nr:hypothetical protein MCOR25_005695 [Pyricularia grisea]
MQESQNQYLAYKQDTRYLLRWIICNYNEILRSQTAKEQQEAETKPKLTGEVTVKELVAMATCIGTQKIAVPSSIFKCLRAVINARTMVAETYKSIPSSDGERDEQAEESNASHAYFIQALATIFSSLGGDEYLESLTGTTDGQVAEPQVPSLSNMFSNLDTNRTTTSNHSSREEEDAVLTDEETEPSKNKKVSSRGKKGKKNKKEDKAAEQDRLRPLEAYKLLEFNEDGEPADYMLAVLHLCRDWIQLRERLGNSWQAVIHRGHNIAGVATSCHFATAMIRESEMAIFVDFPGLETFQNVFTTIARGNQAMPGMFVMQSAEFQGTNKESTITKQELLDPREQFMVNVYEDLVDFLTDYRCTQSGKPTKRMAKKLQGWNPELNLAEATAEERLVWRRCYTINWLYDFVNFFSSVVIKHHLRKTGKDKSQLEMDQVDWLSTGPWFENRKLFGLVEFGGSITKLAMQKPGAAIHEAIAPSLVFQLQCLVDSFVASRGLVYHPFQGAVLRQPNPDFYPQRDIDAFLDRENRKKGKGYLATAVRLNPWVETNSRPNPNIDNVDAFADSFREWLGRCPFDYTEAGLPSSRSSPDGSYHALWDLSPYLCGVGLLEALDIAHCHFIAIWDVNMRPAILIHLYNMLKNSGNLAAPVPALEFLIESMGEAFFNGAAPSTDFQRHYEGLLARQMSQPRIRRQERALRDANRRQDLMAYLDPSNNIIMNKAGLATCYRRARWNRISNADVPHDSSYDLLSFCTAELESNLSTRDLHGVMSVVFSHYQFHCEKPYMAINWPRMGAAVSLVASKLTADVRESHRTLFNDQFRNGPAFYDFEGVAAMMKSALSGKDDGILKTISESLAKQQNQLRLPLYWVTSTVYASTPGASDSC